MEPPARDLKELVFPRHASGAQNPSLFGLKGIKHTTTRDSIARGAAGHEIAQSVDAAFLARNHMIGLRANDTAVSTAATVTTQHRKSQLPPTGRSVIRRNGIGRDVLDAHQGRLRMGFPGFHVGQRTGSQTVNDEERSGRGPFGM